MSALLNLTPVLGMGMLGLYLGLAPVYDLLGAARSELLAVKWALVAGGVLAVTLPSFLQGRLTLPGGLWGPLGFAGLAVLSVPGVVQAPDINTSVMFLLDIAYAAGLLWCFFRLTRDGASVRRIFLVALGLVSVFAVVHAAFAIGQNYGNEAVCAWGPDLRSIYGSHYTAWSISLALVLPVVALLPEAAGRRTGFRITLAGFLCALVLFVSLFIGGGRVGIVGALIALACLALIRPHKFMIVPAVAALSAVVAIVAFNSSCSDHLRLYQFSTVFGLPQGTTAAANTLGTGRFSGYRAAASAVAERPLVGHGIGQVRFEGAHGRPTEIHSLWLKWAAYSGVLAPALFAAMVCVLARKGLRLALSRAADATERVTARAMLVILACGLLVSLVEPNALFGSFQYTAIWWAAAGTLLGLYSRTCGGEFSLPFWRGSQQLQKEMLIADPSRHR